MTKMKNLQFRTDSETYKVIKQYGQGGVGKVYQVKNEKGEEFALKQISQEVVSTEKVKRFNNELHFLHQNTHSNLVPAHDHGLINLNNNETPFYIMPFYGGTLRHLISQGIAPNKVLQYFNGILDCVEFLHSKGVWHRDLKPENILFDEKQDKLLVADLGIAHFQEDEIFTSIITRAGDRLANFLYAAPEQKQKPYMANHKSDIYALGLILNEMFTQNVPLGSGFRRIETIAPAFSFLDNLVENMIQQDPSNRPTIEEVKQVLREANLLQSFRERFLNNEGTTLSGIYGSGAKAIVKASRINQFGPVGCIFRFFIKNDSPSGTITNIGFLVKPLSEPIWGDKIPNSSEMTSPGKIGPGYYFLRKNEENLELLDFNVTSSFGFQTRNEQGTTISDSFHHGIIESGIRPGEGTYFSITGNGFLGNLSPSKFEQSLILQFEGIGDFDKKDVAVSNIELLLSDSIYQFSKKS